MTLAKLALATALCASLAGCGSIQTMMGVEPIGTAAAQAPVVNADTFCAIAQPIPWASTDDPRTQEAAREQNAVGKALCHWQGHAVATTPTP